MIRPVLTPPHPILRQRAVDVVDFTQIASLVCDMTATMRAERGVGLAAPQIGVSLRVFIVDLGYASGPRVFVNPVLETRSGLQKAKEECLSVPGVARIVARARYITVRYQDVAGDVQKLHAHDLLARAIQHENDHLDGVLLLDK